jgi:hypothetical protein
LIDGLSAYAIIPAAAGLSASTMETCEANHEYRTRVY